MRLVQRNPLANSRRVNSMDRRRTRKALISAQIAIDNRALETRTVSGHAKPPKVVSNFRGSVHEAGFLAYHEVPPTSAVRQRFQRFRRGFENGDRLGVLFSRGIDDVAERRAQAVTDGA